MNKILYILILAVLSLKAFSQDTAVYIIKKGDNLYKVSKLYELSVQDLVQQNNLKTQKVFVNQEIKIFKENMLSKEALAINTNNYYKDIYNKKITKNNIYFEKELLKIQNAKDTLDIEKDETLFMEYSKKKRNLNDSIQKSNKIYSDKISKLNAENIALNKKIILRDIKQRKKVNKDDEVIVKDIEAEKERSTQKPKLENSHTQIIKDSKKGKVKSGKLKGKKKKGKVESGKLKGERQKGNVESGKLKGERKKGNVEKNSKENKKSKKNNSIDNDIILLQKDSLFKQLAKNTTFLKKGLDLITEKKKTLDIVTDELEFLKLSKRKKLLSDSISLENKHIYKELDKIENLTDFKNNKKSKEKTSIKKTKKTSKSKNKLKKKKDIIVFDDNKKEQKKTSDIAPNVSKKVEVGKVVIKNKKKIKYFFGDVVDRNHREKAMFYLERARKEIDKSNLKKAKEYIDKSLKLNPSYVDAYILKGDLFSSLTYFDKALLQYRRASILNPNDAQLYYNMGNCFIRLGSEKNAIIEWTKAIKEDDQYILAYAGRASLFQKDKKYKQAIKDYNRIFSINKYFYPAYKSRGVAYLELGEYQKAINDFNSFLEYEPNDSYVIFKRGMAKLSDNEIYNGCVDLLAASELGYKKADKALRKHCEK